MSLTNEQEQVYRAAHRSHTLCNFLQSSDQGSMNTERPRHQHSLTLTWQHTLLQALKAQLRHVNTKQIILLLHGHIECSDWQAIGKLIHNLGTLMECMMF